MVKCTRCESASTAQVGTPPRCLWPEQSSETDSGVIVVGLNPGRAGPEEIAFYNKVGLTFEATISYLRDNSTRIPYFSELRRFVQAAFGKRSIYWTEVAKCELKHGQANVPLEMRRTCIELHLKAELSLLPISWPVVAAGRVAFETMAVLCTDRAVLGVPHPTGAFGRQFSTLFAGSTLSVRAAQQASFVLSQTSAKWLGGGEA